MYIYHDNFCFETIGEPYTACQQPKLNCSHTLTAQTVRLCVLYIAIYGISYSTGSLRQQSRQSDCSCYDRFIQWSLYIILLAIDIYLTWPLENRDRRRAFEVTNDGVQLSCALYVGRYPYHHHHWYGMVLYGIIVLIYTILYYTYHHMMHYHSCTMPTPHSTP